MFGFLNINKPTGLTSRRAVDAVKKRVRPAKVGHTGTLDPLASGVLLVAVGPATRLAQFVLEQTKSYDATYRLGVTSTTDDTEGEIQPVENAPAITRDQLAAALDAFRGEIDQVPPEFSAVKVDGRRAYRLARRGRSVALQPRKVAIHELELLDFAYPEFRVKVRCGSGTYLRSLGRDIGRALQSGAVMTALVRTEVGTARVEEAIELDDLQRPEWKSSLMPPQAALPHISTARVSREQIERLGHGLLLDQAELDSNAADDQRLLALDDRNRLMAILMKHDTDRYRPAINFISYWQPG